MRLMADEMFQLTFRIENLDQILENPRVYNSSPDKIPIREEVEWQFENEAWTALGPWIPMSSDNGPNQGSLDVAVWSPDGSGSLGP